MKQQEIETRLIELEEQYELAESVLHNTLRLLDRLSAQIQPLEDMLTRMESSDGSLRAARTLSELRLAG